MLVTEIVKTSKSRYQIFFEDETSVMLYGGELHKYRIQAGCELPEEVCQQLTQETLPKRAKLRCMNLLQTKDYTEKQLVDKLRDGGYSQECIEEALGYVKEYGYVDDARYARSYIEDHLETRSRNRIELDLFRKGIAKETIQDAFRDMEKDGICQDEITMICRLLEKKNYAGKNATIQEKQRIYGFLSRRGFRHDAIARALSLDITSN